MKFLCVTGYGATGQTALLDLIREFKNYNIPPNFEFRLIKDPHGIIDLENFLVNDWDILRSDYAIKDFLELCNVINRKDLKLFQIGYDYQRDVSKSFILDAHTYINKISTITYLGKSRIYDFKLSKYDFFKKKLLNKLFGLNKSSVMFLSQPNKEQFIIETRKFIEQIFKNFSGTADTIVVDNAIPTSNITKALNYFNSIKLIIVDRDPRDTYVDLRRKNLLIGAELIASDDVYKYIKWFKTIRHKTNIDNKNIIKIKFEDLILDYDNTLKEIKQFLGDDIEHIDKFKFLDPQKSRKNIGIWKDYPNQEVMTRIANELPEYCYN